MEIRTILDQIDLGSMALPEFQRGYVWNRDQVRKLMDSLYHRYPVGGLLVWRTKTENADTRGDGVLSMGSVDLLLDGQQRITSLYGIIRGKPPRFFDGNAQAFMDLHFNIEEQTFEFYGPLKMKNNPLWISVTALMQQGVGTFIQSVVANSDMQPKLTTYINRLAALEGIKNIDLHVELVTGEDRTVDTVVDIFNMVNSGGTKLSSGDLALAKICATWPDARDEMKGRLQKWRRVGFNNKLDWLLRCINAVTTGRAPFSSLKDIDTSTFRNGLMQTEKAVDRLLNLISARLGLDHDRVIGSRYSFPVLARYLVQKGGQLSDHEEQDKLLYWYIHTFLWGRYSGSTESVISQDLAAIEAGDGGLDRLIENLRSNRGDLTIRQSDFSDWSLGARFYPMLYMLTRVSHVKDWGSGVELSNYLLGHLSRLELHHIFPKAMLYKHGYGRAQVNALANFTFLTQETNLEVSDKNPMDYMPHYAKKHPGALESHWIPTDPDLWKPENYPQFLEARRELLAKAANSFLDSLVAGTAPEAVPAADRAILTEEQPAQVVLGGIGSEEEDEILRECNDWVVSQGLPSGEFSYELSDPLTGEPLAVLDLAWPNGLQEGLSDPAALLIDESTDIEEILNRARYLFFTDVGSFRHYVTKDILALDEPVIGEGNAENLDGMKQSLPAN